MASLTRHALPVNPKMTREDFYRLCDKLCEYEWEFVFLSKPERGTKAKSKRVRQELRTILTPSQLAQLTKEARNYNAFQNILRLNEDDEDPILVRRRAQDADSAWRRILPNIYYSTFTFPDA